MWCVLLSIFMCIIFYFGLDPMKCRFFLVLSLGLISPVISFGIHVWYAYYICMIFLSGVFVILVYFSSLSKFSYMKKPFWFVLFLLGLCGSDLMFEVLHFYEGLNEFYYDCFWFVMCYLVFLLVFFLNFVSYYLSVGVAIRRMWIFSLIWIFCLQQKGLKILWI